MPKHKSIITFFGSLSHICSVSPEAPSPEKLMANGKVTVFFNWLPLTHGHMFPSPRCPPALPVHVGMVGAPSAGEGEQGQSDRRPSSLPSPETSPSAPHSPCRLSPGSVPAATGSPRGISCSALWRTWIEAGSAASALHHDRRIGTSSSEARGQPLHSRPPTPAPESVQGQVYTWGGSTRQQGQGDGVLGRASCPVCMSL